MFELSLLCPEGRIEAVGEALEALDALSVSVEDADAQTEAEQALFGEPGMPPPRDGWQRSRVVALFPTQEAAGEARALLEVQDFFDGCRVLGLAEVPDQDWVRLTQSQFAPVEITPEFWIVPTWHELPRRRRATSGWIRAWPSAPERTRPRACACAGSPSTAVASAGAGLRLRLGHPRDRGRQVRRHRHRRRGTSIPPPWNRRGSMPKPTAWS